MVKEKRCARCGKRTGIIIERASGQPIVVDAEPVWMIRDDAGPAWALSVDGALWHGHRRPRGTPGAVICYMPHCATCPNKKGRESERGAESEAGSGADKGAGKVYGEPAQGAGEGTGGGIRAVAVMVEPRKIPIEELRVRVEKDIAEKRLEKERQQRRNERDWNGYVAAKRVRIRKVKRHGTRKGRR